MIFVGNQLPNSACLIRDLISDVLSKAVKNKVGSPRLKTILVSRPLDINPGRSTALWELKEREGEHATIKKTCYLPTTLVNWSRKLLAPKQTSTSTSLSLPHYPTLKVPLFLLSRQTMPAAGSIINYERFGLRMIWLLAIVKARHSVSSPRKTLERTKGLA